MKKTKLVNMLEGLDEKERKAFLAHARKGHSEQLALKLLESLLKEMAKPSLVHPDETLMEMAIDRLAANPQDQAERKGWHNLSSKVTRWLEDFLLLEKLGGKKNLLRDRLIAEIYMERQLGHLFDLCIQDLDKRYGEHANPGQWDLMEALRVKHAQYYTPWEGKEKSREEGRRLLEEAMALMDALHLAAKLRYACEMLNRRAVLEEEFNLSDWDSIKEKASTWKGPGQTLIKAYYFAAGLLEYEEETTYEAMRDFFDKHHAQLSDEDCFVLHGYMVNHLARALKNPDPKKAEAVKEELMRLCEFLFGHEGLLSPKLLSADRFVNLVNTATKMGDSGRARELVAQYTKHLHAKLREFTRPFAEANILVAEGRPKEAARILNGLRHPTVRMEIRIRSLHLLCEIDGVTETNEDIIRICDNLLEYLKQHKATMGEKERQGFEQFAKIIKQAGNPSKAGQLMERVNLSENIQCKGWLLRLLQRIADAHVQKSVLRKG